MAYSGGRDSTALLHATLRAAAPLGVEVLALHVHHALHADADDWLAHCRATCRRWHAGFAATRLQTRPLPGQSVEAWARAERYRALAAMARSSGVSLVLLAQHRRDQAETFLLQALRGASAAGLAAMPARFEQDGIAWARPWLQQPREAIEAYLRRHRLRFIEDGSNADPRFARSRLRLDVWPSLVRAFTDAEHAFAAAAARSAQASDVLDEVAAADLAHSDDEGTLDVKAWLNLSPARRRNALLAWLRRHGVASAALLERLMQELPAARSAGWPAGAGDSLRLYRGRLRFDGCGRPPCHPTARAEARLRIDGPGRYALAEWAGCLIVRRVERHGVAPERLASLRVAARRGGETFQLAPRSTPRSLKKQYQSLGLPASQRDGPLFYAGEQLVFAPGLGIDARVRAGDDAPQQFGLQWQRDVDR